MKLSYNLKTWYWIRMNGECEIDVPQWWLNFIREVKSNIDREIALKPYATYRTKGMTDKCRVVFKSPEDLTFFILRWS